MRWPLTMKTILSMRSGLPSCADGLIFRARLRNWGMGMAKAFVAKSTVTAHTRPDGPDSAQHSQWFPLPRRDTFALSRHDRCLLLSGQAEAAIND
jgi:hypothetical protein